MSMSDRAYAPAWKRYRRLRPYFWLAAAGFVLSSLATVLAGKPSHLGGAILIPFVFWLNLAVVISLYKRFRCPRCNKEFERRWPNKKYPDRNTCPHCGLPKFAKDGNETNAK